MKILTVLLLLLIICGSLIPNVSARPIRRGHRSYGHAHSRHQNRHGRQTHPNNHNHAHPITRINYHVEIFQVGRGPESLAFDSDGKGPYYGTADGAIERLERNGSVTHIAYTNPNRPLWCDHAPDGPLKEATCGRPLGTTFNNQDHEFFIADSSFGILMIKNGRIHILVTGFKGVPFKFVNGIDYDPINRILYFSDTSLNYHRWQYREAMNPRNNDRSGRLFSFNLRTRELKLLLSNLSFANGVALGQHMNFVLVGETTAQRITRLWLTGPEAGTDEVWMEGIGNVDNIKRNEKGEIIIARNYPASPLRVDENANILEVLSHNAISDDSDATEHNGIIWVGSVERDVILKFTPIE